MKPHSLNLCCLMVNCIISKNNSGKQEVILSAGTKLIEAVINCPESSIEECYKNYKQLWGAKKGSIQAVRWSSCNGETGAGSSTVMVIWQQNALGAKGQASHFAPLRPILHFHTRRARSSFSKGT